MPIVSGKPTVKIKANQIVVDLEQLGRLLTVLPVEFKVTDRNTALKLALIDVSLPPVSDAEAGAQVGGLISDLHKAYKTKYDDELIIGKNRIVGSVHGSPYTGGGSGAADPYTGGIAGKGQGGAQLAEGKTLPERREARRSVRVGILDTRLFGHTALAGRYLASSGAMVPGDQAATAAATPPAHQVHANLAHATFIAGVVLQRAPDVDLEVRRGLDENAATSSSWDIAVKMAEFADAGLAVLNISFGAITEDDEAPLVLERAVQALDAAGVTIVAAAGNNGPSSPKMWPAALPQVIAVGADQANGQIAAHFSPVDPKWVDLMAPGETVYSTYEDERYATWDGTSFAAAAVSGAIAYLMQTEGMAAEEAAAWLRTPPTARKGPQGAAAMDDIRPI